VGNGASISKHNKRQCVCVCVCVCDCVCVCVCVQLVANAQQEARRQRSAASLSHLALQYVRESERASARESGERDSDITTHYT